MSFSGSACPRGLTCCSPGGLPNPSATLGATPRATHQPTHQATHQATPTPPPREVSACLRGCPTGAHQRSSTTTQRGVGTGRDTGHDTGHGTGRETHCGTGCGTRAEGLPRSARGVPFLITYRRYLGTTELSESRPVGRDALVCGIVSAACRGPGARRPGRARRPVGRQVGRQVVTSTDGSDRPVRHSDPAYGRSHDDSGDDDLPSVL